MLALLLAAALAAAEPPVVVLDPGHGGPDWGATVKGRREKDIALAVARRLKARLERDGAARVKLTREGDVYVPLDERMSPGALFVSLHANKVGAKSVKGMVVYAWGKHKIKRAKRARSLGVPPLPPPPKETIQAGRRLAAAFSRALRAEGFEASPDHADLYVLKNPAAPAILVEMGYLSNPGEARLLDDESYQEKLAEAMARGLLVYLNETPAVSRGR